MVTGYDLAKAWSEAPAFMPHGAGCACAGHVALHVDPGAVESDLLDFLAMRYQGEGLSELASMIVRRQVERGTTFATWLGRLDREPLSAEARARLLADLHATISSLAQAESGGHG